MLETLLANVPLEDFLPRQPEKKVPPKPQGGPEPEPIKEEPAARAGAQGAPPGSSAAPGPKLCAAFGPGGPSVEDVRLAVRGAYPPNPGRPAEGAAAAAAAAAAGEPAPGHGVALAVAVERRPEAPLSRKRSLE